MLEGDRATDALVNQDDALSLERGNVLSGYRSQPKKPVKQRLAHHILSLCRIMSWRSSAGCADPLYCLVGPLLSFGKLDCRPSRDDDAIDMPGSISILYRRRTMDK